ncbi:hypothetical protein lbkm_3883 [Lachnospiraceae bacterium KM106-2]|nr:hypothetical protein lbkm_3883 [Lachnospiraceae bacterium KM106-2]
MNNRLIAIIATAGTLAACIVVNAYLACPDVMVTIYNNTNVSLKGLVVTYDNAHKGKDVGTLGKYKNCNVNIDLPGDFSEGEISLHYHDKKNQEHAHILVPYFEKGQNQKIKVHIRKITKDKKLEIEV